MTGTPGLMMPAFSRAIAASVLPSWRMWSKLIDVITLTAGRQTFVESSRPPRPTSSTAASTWRSTKCKQRHRGGDFEIGRPAAGIAVGGRLFIHRSHFGLHAIDERDQFVGRAGLAVDGEAFFDPLQMGRAEQAGAVTGGGEHRRDHGGRGAFALGAGHVDDLQAGIRLAEPREQLPHAVELELPLLIRHERRALVVDAAEEPIERGLAGRMGRLGRWRVSVVGG